ncbi:MAG: zinc ABC transporter substrate-binding protein [Verrucomicrobiota bacterium]|nr:zinc ABC transporter substrate-binding protein [Verrucomicrobiota bacterium]
MKLRFFIIMLCSGILSSCLICRGESADNQLHIFTTIAPHAFFAKRIGGENVKVKVVLRPGENPATYSPSVRQITKLGESDILFCVGVPFENAFVPKIKVLLPQLKIIDVADGMRTRKMNGCGHHGHACGIKADKTSEIGNDPHTWMSPVLAQKQAKIICKIMIEMNEEKKTFYSKNLKLLLNDLQILHQKITKVLAPMKGKDLFVFHPAFGYFADEYAMEQVAIEKNGKEPSAKELMKIISSARKHNVKIIFTQKQFSLRSAEKIANAIRGKVIPIDSLNYNYIENLYDIAKKVKEGK